MPNNGKNTDSSTSKNNSLNGNRKKFQCPELSSINQNFETPVSLVKSLENLYGKFQLDAAADANNAKAPRYFDEEDNGLAEDCRWEPRTFCNPPFEHSQEFILKAISERDRHGVTTTMLIAGRIGRKYWKHIYEEAAEVLVIHGHITFTGAPNPATFPVVIIRFVPGERMGQQVIQSGPYEFYRLCGESTLKRSRLKIA